MCEPVTASAVLVGTAAGAGTAATTAAGLAVAGAGVGASTAAIGSAAAVAAGGTAATAGLFGAGGAFSLGTTLSTLSYVGSAAMSLANAAQGNAQLQYQAGMAGYRAQINENNAMAARFSARYDADAFQRRFNLATSGQGPGYAASGVVINQDTPAMISDDTVMEGQLERLAILYRGNTAATAAEQGAAGERAASGAYKSRAEGLKTAGYIGAGTSLMAGAAKAYG
jgi:hypothetical protein